MCWKDNTLQSHTHKQILQTKMSWKSWEEVAQQNCFLTSGIAGSMSPVRCIPWLWHWGGNASHEVQASTIYNSRWWNTWVLISSECAFLWQRPFPHCPPSISRARKITMNSSSALKRAEIHRFQLWIWNGKLNNLQLHTKRMATSFGSRNTSRVKLTSSRGKHKE